VAPDPTGAPEISMDVLSDLVQFLAFGATSGAVYTLVAAGSVLCARIPNAMQALRQSLGLTFLPISGLSR
jgi:hypothetical protein